MAALATNGQCSVAAEVDAMALEMEREDEKADYRMRLELYQAGQAYREM